MKTTQKDRFAELDGLRGIAALWVVVYHYIDAPRGYWLKDDPGLAKAITPWNINLWGLLAVNLFFIISGFVIFMTIRRSSTVTDFAASRAARLYPAFWISVLVTTFIAITFPVPAQHVTVGQAAINATMLQFFLGVRSVEPVYWSLGYEIGFYVLMATVFACGMLRRVELFGCVWVVISLVLLKLFPMLGAHIPWRIQTLIGLPYASLFFAGIIFYKIWAEGPTLARIVLIALCYFEHILGHDLVWAGIMTAVFGVFSLCVAGYGRWFASRPLVFLGAISYSLYLIHGTLGFRVQLFNYALGLSPTVNLLVATAVAVCAATGITFLIERPAGRAMRAAYRRVARLPIA